MHKSISMRVLLLQRLTCCAGPRERDLAVPLEVSLARNFHGVSPWHGADAGLRVPARPERGRVIRMWGRAIIGLPAAIVVTLNVAWDPPAHGAGRPAAQPAAAQRLDEPRLPSTPYRYVVELPRHFSVDGGPDSLVAADNTPAHNPVTDAGAALGRVLFYDTRLSAEGSVSCGSCHRQRHGFSDPRRLSIGFDGEPTRRHGMSLANARYYARGRFFWDERAETLEAQVLAPIEDPIEMGSSLDAVEARLAETPFYPSLFARAFGSPEVTRDRIARALAQFVRALVSFRAPYDDARASGPAGSSAFLARLTPAARHGYRLFSTPPGNGRRGAGCAQCHAGDAQISLGPRNIGLDGFDGDPDGSFEALDPEGGGDAGGSDAGAGDGRFKAPSLRNVAIRHPYMHDGRFASLREVIEHYDAEVAPHPFLDMNLLDRRLVVTGGPVRPIRLELTEQEIAALIAFLESLTDPAFLTDHRFSDPFLPASEQG